MQISADSVYATLVVPCLYHHPLQTATSAVTDLSQEKAGFFFNFFFQ